MATRIRAWAAAVLVLCGRAVGLVNVSIVCFNLETMHITWPPGDSNFSFVFRFDPEPFRPCPHYVLRGGVTAGCVFPAKLALLDFSILDGALELLNEKHLATQYLKPASLVNLTFAWRDDAVRVTCPDLPWPGLDYHVQYRSAFDLDWQSHVESTCDVTVWGLDSEKCYDFRSRVTTKFSYYGPDTYPSDWSDVTHWRGGRRTESCSETQFPPSRLLRAVLPCVFLVLLSVLLLSLWKLRRAKSLLPYVPDPKRTFRGLFEMHDGNFQVLIPGEPGSASVSTVSTVCITPRVMTQSVLSTLCSTQGRTQSALSAPRAAPREWIRDTGHGVALPRPEGKGPDGAEQVLVVQLCPAEPRVDPPNPQAELCAQRGSPGPDAQPGPAVALGDFTFRLNEKAYMVL